MDDEKIFSYLSSEDPKLIIKAFTLLQGKMASNNGILVIKDIGKLKSWIVQLFETKDKLSESKVFAHLFDFLTSFLAHNYGRDYEVQFISHILGELVRYWTEWEDSTLEFAEESLETYIRTFKQLENIIDIINTKFLSSDEPKLIIKGIKLSIK